MNFLARMRTKKKPRLFDRRHVILTPLLCRRMQPAPATCGDPRLSSRRVTAQIARAHAAYFLTNGRSKFWGAGFHVEKLINALREAELSLGRRRAAAPPVLVDVGAAPYNTIGGDISHVLTMASLWNESSAMILGFEPGVHPFSRLKDFIGKAVGRPARDCLTDCADDAGQTANVASADGACPAAALASAAVRHATALALASSHAAPVAAASSSAHAFWLTHRPAVGRAPQHAAQQHGEDGPGDHACI